ncbi:MAG: hypothetical protein ACXVVQ_05215 [Solirubrobacteraceae bacterium]
MGSVPVDESGNLRPLRLAALELANDARNGRAELKRQIAAGVVSVADVLIDPPPVAAGSSVSALLVSQRGWGRIKSRRFLSSNDVSETRKLGELSQRQRELLAADLRSLDSLSARPRERAASQPVPAAPLPPGAP